MARAYFVKKARKAIRSAGINKGDSYWWWKFRYGDKRVSKTKPRRSQLTQSDFYGAMYDWEDQVAEMTGTQISDLEEASDQLHSIADEVESFGQEQADKISNMPDSLQQSPTAEMLQGRADACEEIAQSLRDAADALASVDLDNEELDVEAEIRSAIESVNWSYE